MAFDEGNTGEPAAGNGNTIQRFGPGHPHFDFCRGQAPVLSRRSRRTWSRRAPSWPRGDELPGEPESDGAWTWLTFRAPDGNIHGLGARMT